MARTITWVASVGVALAAFYACSTPPPALPRGGGASDDGAAAAGGTGGATGGLSGQLTGGVSGTGGKSAGGTGGGSAGGVGGAMGGSSGGVSTGGAGGSAMGGAGGGLPQVGNRDSNFLNTGEQGCNNDTGCSGFVSPSPQGGTVLREYWGNIPTVGYPVDLYLGKIEAMTSCQFSPNFPDNPDSSDQMSKGLKSYQPFVSAQPNNYGDNYGERIRGYIKAPVTGNYTFWLTSDNSSMLFISTEIALNQTESTPLNARVRAVVDDYRPEGVFDTPGQKSQAVAMDIGKYYYFDLFHREWLGDDHWEVRWTRPDMPGTFETVPKEVLYTAVKIMGAPLSRNCPNATGGTSGAGGSGGAPSAAGAGGN